MPRKLRAIAVGVPHHLTQRGNHCQSVFFSDDDRRQYLAWLGEYAARYEMQIWAYCLMTTHVHLVSTPLHETALARSMQMTHMRYTQRVNQLQGWNGHLWQGRFFSCPLDEQHLWTAIRYVEQNPKRAGLVTDATEYPWSSAAAHAGMRIDPLLMELPGCEFIPDWAAWLANEDSLDSAIIRAHTMQGAPCGSTTFCQQLSIKIGRSLTLRSPGRPRNSAEEPHE